MALWRVNCVAPENRAAVMIAWYDGKAIEVACAGDYMNKPQWYPVTVDPTNWDWNRYAYRVSEVSSPTKFWMVYNPSHNAPRISHSTYEKAKAEAERLASLHPDQNFYVLESVSITKAIKTPIQTTKI